MVEKPLAGHNVSVKHPSDCLAYFSAALPLIHQVETTTNVFLGILLFGRTAGTDKRSPKNVQPAKEA